MTYTDAATGRLAEGTPGYLDPSLPVDERVADLVGRMTTAEKLGQMMQLDARGDLDDIVLGKLAGSVLHATPERLHHAHDLVQRTRLRIPLLVGEDCVHGHSFWPGATIFPVQLAMAATFDADLVERVARATAVEVARTGIHWVLSPVLCIARDPRWGRVNESFGEDPLLIAELGAAMIRGYQGQGPHDPDAVLACAKHFAGYSETQGGRDASEADLSMRKLRSWFLPPFERAVQEGCRTFMLGYQAIDGVPITANGALINDVLKGEWGFHGTLITDWDNVGRMVGEQKVCADLAEAAAVAIRAGIDLSMATPGFAAGAAQAVRRGLVEEADIDRAVRRILQVKFELGLFEDPRPPTVRHGQVIATAEHAELNLEIARRSLVLLRNDGVLPLDHTQGPFRLAVIGPNADDAQGQLGDWAGSSGQIDWMPDGHPRDTIDTVLDGLRALAPRGWQVSCARGADIVKPGPTKPPGGYPGGVDPAAVDEALLEEAVALAQASHHAVVVVGDHLDLTGECRSTATLELFGAQIALLDAVIATGTPTTVIVMSGKPLVLPDAALRASALIQAFSPGMRGGRAVAELLLGLIEPTGRLPMSIPRHAGQIPVYYNTVRGQHGHRYADLTQEPQFTFGAGLSYTTIEYSDLHVHSPVVDPSGLVSASVRLTNTGTRPALETVQVYIRDLVTSATWADLELKAWTQVQLQPGATEIVHLQLPASACTLVTADGHRIVEPGAFELLAGPSSRPADLLAGAFRIVTQDKITDTQ